MVDLYKQAWDVVKKDYVAWLVLYGVFFLVVSATMGLGGVLWPNVLRETRQAVREERAPGLSLLFNLDKLANDAINYVVYYGAIMATSMVGLTVFAQVGLSWQMVLAAEDQYSPIDNAKLSVKHVLGNLGDHVMFMLVASALILPTMCLCFLPLPLVMPIVGVAQWLWYEREIQHFDTLATDSGIPRQLTG